MVNLCGRYRVEGAAAQPSNPKEETGSLLPSKGILDRLQGKKHGSFRRVGMATEKVRLTSAVHVV